MLFAGLKPILRNKKISQKGLPHPEQRRWHAQMTSEEKKEYAEKISKGMLKFHANKTDKQAKRIIVNKVKGKLAYYATNEGLEDIEYHRYIRKKDIEDLSKEEIERRSKLRSKGMKAFWKRISPKTRQKYVDRLTKKHIREKLIEVNVPRIKNYCGVVREA